jgi:hypothetical protein
MLAAGDKVKILDEPLEGVIRKVSGRNLVIEIDGFEYDYTADQVIKTSGNEITHQDIVVDEMITHEVAQRNKKIPFRPTGKNRSGIPEIDLHLERLIDHTGHIPRDHALSFQLQKLEHFIADCRAQKIREFVVIHGVGKGILSAEVKRVLREHGDLEYAPASYDEYAYGALKVIIRGLFRNQI